MREIRVNTNKQEVEYKGLFFPFKAVKATLQNTMPEESFFKWCVHKTFNPITGHIDRKYAWDSIFQHFAEAGVLTNTLDTIIKNEKLYDIGAT